MALASVYPGSGRGANALRSMWDREIKLKANEEMVIAADFERADAEKVGDTMYVRILPTVTINTLANTDNAGPENLTWETGEILRVSTTPVAHYAAVGLPLNLTERLVAADQSKLRAGYRQQIRKGLDAKLDSYCAQALGPSISAVKGPFNADKTNLLDCVQTIRTNAKEHVKNGTTVHIKYHPSQIKYLNSIAEIANAEVRGDAENPNVKGFISKGFGFTFAETGNIYNNGTHYLNLVFASSAFTLGYNAEPTILAPQTSGLQVGFLGYQDFGVVEVFDEDALVWKSA